MTPPPIDDHLSPHVVVTITMREVYDAVLTLTGRVDAVLARQDETARDVADHETRLRALEQASVPPSAVARLDERTSALERARWPLPSLAALTALGALVLALLTFLQR